MNMTWPCMMCGERHPKGLSHSQDVTRKRVIRVVEPEPAWSPYDITQKRDREARGHE